MKETVLGKAASSKGAGLCDFSAHFARSPMKTVADNNNVQAKSEHSRTFTTIERKLYIHAMRVKLKIYCNTHVADVWCNGSVNDHSARTHITTLIRQHMWWC